MMLKRRTMTTFIGAAPLIASSALGQRAWGQSGSPAAALVRTTSDQLIAIVSASGSREDRRRRLKQVIDATVDIDDLARFCLGRFWQSAAPDQRAQYLARFEEMMVIEISGHLGEYRGVLIAIGPVRANADTEIVVTTVTRPDNPATQVDWVVSTQTGRPKIVDLIAGGTSMRLTQRGDFSAYLASHQNDMRELIEAMGQKVTEGE
jgi:phospholipid transport system substrate-binding protein